MIAPIPLKEIGLQEFNRVGIAPDAAGNPYICFAGSAKQLALLSGLPGVQRWVAYDCLAYPLNRTNLLVTETVGRVEEATDEYVQARNELLVAPREQYAHLYPPTPPGEPEPFQHQIDAFCMACSAFEKGFRGFGQYSHQGCIEGDAIVNINRSGIGKRITLRDLYYRFNGCSPRGNRKKNPAWDLNTPTFIRSLCYGEFRRNQVRAVLFQGKRSVLRITTQSGKSIRVTPDHEIAIPNNEWVRAIDLSVGNAILVNGTWICAQCGTQDSCRHGIRQRTKYPHLCKHCAYSAAMKQRPVSNMRGNKHPSYKTGRFKDKSGYVLLTGMYGHHREQSGRGWVYEHIVVAEGILGRSLHPGEWVHHRDENPSNNDPSNLQIVSSTEHNLAHRRHRNMNGGHGGKGGEICFIPKEEIILSIEPDGETDVYDVVVADPHRNFVANGIVVHNCGKSRWACDLLRRFGRPVSVVIVQNSTILQWKDWLTRICSDFEIRLLSGIPIPRRAALIEEVARGKRLFPHPVIFLVNWEVISRLQDSFVRLQPNMVIADEASRAKERTAAMSKALHRIGAAAERRIAMTGTPMGNGPGDLWSIYKFLEPSLFPKSYWDYMKTYFMLGGFSGNEFIGFNPNRVSDFVERMYASAYRITKASIGDLPPKLFEVVRLEMTEEQQRLYQQVEEDLYASRLQEDGSLAELTIANVLVQTVRLQQITAGLFPVNAGDDCGVRSVPIASAKTAWLQSYCQDAMRDTDAQIVVWARFTAEIDAIVRALSQAGLRQDRDFAFIDGRVKGQDRRSLQVAFNDRDNPLRILICQIAAVALGFDIPACDTLIYHSGTFSHLERAQSLERGHRMGRTRPYTVIDLVCRNSIDAKILQAVKRKENLADMLLVEGFV